MQLNLSFLDIPSPSQKLWTSLDEEQRQDIAGKLSRLIANAAFASESNEKDASTESHDD